MQFKLLYSS